MDFCRAGEASGMPLHDPLQTWFAPGNCSATITRTFGARVGGLLTQGEFRHPSRSRGSRDYRTSQSLRG